MAIWASTGRFRSVLEFWNTYFTLFYLQAAECNQLQRTPSSKIGGGGARAARRIRIRRPRGGGRAKSMHGLLRTSVRLQKVPKGPASCADPTKSSSLFSLFRAPARIFLHFGPPSAGREIVGNPTNFRPPQKPAKNGKKRAPGRQSAGF